MKIQGNIRIIESFVIAFPTSPCFYPAFEILRVDFAELPSAYAGPDAAICENQDYQLNGAVLYESSFKWESSGDGTFNNDQILTQVYIPGVENLQNGLVQISLTAETISPCELATISTMVPSIQDIPCQYRSKPLDMRGPDPSALRNGGECRVCLWQTSGDRTFDNVQSPDAVNTSGTTDIVNGTVELSLVDIPISPCLSSDISFNTLDI